MSAEPPVEFDAIEVATLAGIVRAWAIAVERSDDADKPVPALGGRTPTSIAASLDAKLSQLLHEYGLTT